MAGNGIMGLLKGAEPVGGLIDSGWNMYTDLENLKINRANSREQRKSAQLGRLLNLLQSGQGMTDNLASRGRLYSLRNPGV